MYVPGSSSFGSAAAAPCTSERCHGDTCLLGTCLCSDGRGGEWCERGSARTRACATYEEAAYGITASGIARHALHDYCAFYEPAYGIVSVDERRWHASQQWEAALWAGSPAGQTTDRNEHHARLFGGYRALPDALGRVVELGSGPYTQLQTILRADSSATSITLVDPLAEHYMTHTKGCTYKSGRLVGRERRPRPHPSLPRTHSTSPHGHAPDAKGASFLPRKGRRRVLSRSSDARCGRMRTRRTQVPCASSRSQQRRFS